jgi:predicted aconitase with swiveling domain
VTASFEFPARGIVNGVVSGSAFVSTEPISFLGDLEIATGIIVNTRHASHGGCVAGTVLVLPHTIGSAGAWRFLYQLFVHGTNPVAIVQTALPDSSLVQGAILAHVPVVCAPDVDVAAVIRAGDDLVVDATAGVVRVTRARGPRVGTWSPERP